MAGWYSGGTVTVTNGSTVVTGAGTDFVNNVAARDAFALVGGNPNEIASVQSATQLTLARPWLGASGAGQPYVIIPTVGVYVDLALRALNMLTPFQAVLDGVGQGLFGDGSVAAPGVRFIADQDTGVRRAGENALALVAGGVDRLVAEGTGRVSVGATIAGSSGALVIRKDAAADYSPANMLAGGAVQTIQSYQNNTARVALLDFFNFNSRGAIGLTYDTTFTGSLVFGTSPGSDVCVERMRIDSSGNLLVGFSAGSFHRIGKSVAENSEILQVDNPAAPLSLQVRAVAAGGFNLAGTALLIGKNSSTGRSANAGGTINASGADYAEYLTKAPGCGTIAKGDVCGVDRDGLLTRTWADAVRYVVKSTDPNLVGGDTWASHLPPGPKAPGEAPAAPITPAPSAAASMPVEPTREDGEDDDAFIQRMAAYLVAAAAAVTAQQADAGAMAAYQADLATYPQREAEHDAAVAAYEAALAGWEDDLETARLTVDRIAFSGQVPVNVDAATLDACEVALADGEAVYLVAVARGGGIGVNAVREGDMTLPLYMRRIGAVWAIRDGRPWVDVQHG